MIISGDKQYIDSLNNYIEETNQKIKLVNDELNKLYQMGLYSGKEHDLDILLIEKSKLIMKKSTIEDCRTLFNAIERNSTNDIL